MTMILESKGVTKRFGGLVAVGDFTLDIEEQMIASLIGPNGAGKTTFFNCVTGWLPAMPQKIPRHTFLRRKMC